MLRPILLAALFGSTALTPTPARADPVTAAIAAVSSSFAAVGVAAGLSAATAAAFGAYATKFIISLGMSAIANALRPRPELPKPSARMVNYAQSVVYQERVYGRVRKGGPFGFTSFASKARHYTVILAAHSTLGPVEHWLDERRVELDEQNEVSTEPLSGVVAINTHLGQPDQLADPDLMAMFPQWTTDHKMTGLSYAYVRANRVSSSKFSEKYPTGREPAYNPVWDGNDRIYDPRDQQFKFTRNLALIWAHELTVYQGLDVDWSEVAIEADVCDELVLNADGDWQPRWRFDGVISDDMDFEDIRTQVMAAGDVFTFERPDGTVGFRVGRWIEPTVTLTEHDFHTLQFSDGEGFAAANEFVVQYVEPANQWRESPSGVWIERPSARRVRDEIAAFFISNHNQASRINKRVSRAKSARYKIKGQLKFSGYDLIGERFAQFTHTELGVSFPIEIGRLSWGSDRSTFGLEAVSTAEEDFDFVAANEEPERPVYESLGESNEVDEPSGVVASITQSGGGAASIIWAVNEQPESYRLQFRVREEPAGLWAISDIPEGEREIIKSGLVDGVAYSGQFRNLENGVASGWVPEAPVTLTAVANQVAPAALTDFVVVGSALTASVSFVAPNDQQYFATRIYRNVGSADFNSAALVHTEFGVPSPWADEGLPAGMAVSYWAAPVNSSFIPGPVSGPITINTPS